MNLCLYGVVTAGIDCGTVLLGIKVHYDGPVRYATFVINNKFEKNTHPYPPFERPWGPKMELFSCQNVKVEF